MTKVRTRFAPSPTGFLHIGGLRTAFYSYVYARQNKGKFILRIEDTDQSRYVPNSVENIIKSLKWAGIDYDEGPDKEGEYGPYFQSKRLDLYKKYADKLVKQGKAYYCFCTKERLDEVRAKQKENKLPPKYDKHCCNLSEKKIKENLENKTPYVIRMNVPENQDITFNETIRGKVSINSNEVDDQVIIKSDGFPTYHLAVVVDDHLMEISHVIRGEEWLPSTPKHILLYKFLGWEPPIFAHLPLLLNPDKSKLSKRQNDISVKDYINKGYLPEALINFVALLGWNPGDDREVLSINDMIKEFKLDDVHKAGAVFNIEKLNWLNGLYIRELAINKLYKKSIQFYKDANIDINDEDYVKKVITLEQTRIKTFSELPKLTDYFFKDKLDYDPKILIWKKGDTNEAIDRLTKINKFLEKYSDNWEIKSIENNIKAYIDENKLGTGNTLWPLRVALCGKQNSPSPFELLWALGKEKSLQRIQHALNLLQSK